MKKLHLLFPLFLFLSCNSFSSDHNINLNVRYSQNLDVRLSEDLKTPNIVEDFLEIGQQREGNVPFKFWLNQSNGHVCRISGVSQIIDGSFLMYSKYMKHIETTCILKIYETSGFVVIEDVDGECRKNYCGARGSIGKTSLPLSSKTVLSSPVDMNAW
ncbi:hypothetical protein [Sessilibacter corallicola]|uniref:Lipoprotein n=1 Tax=Sessilibacter corallicola TaxID=2904075 RepID=A0ABQ0AF67_9GAMM